MSSDRDPPATLVVRILGSAVCEGQTRRGVRYGPSALREGGHLHRRLEALGWVVEDLGDLVQEEGRAWFSNGSTEGTVPTPDPIYPSADEFLVVTTPAPANPSPHYYTEDIIRSSQLGIINRCISEASFASASESKFVLNLGGDHSIATGSISGLSKVHPDIFVVWVDAHGDMNTPETSLTHLYHGMPLAHLMGWFKRPAIGFDWLHAQHGNSRPSVLRDSNVALLGARDLDEEEEAMLCKSSILRFDMKQIEEEDGGIDAVLQHVIDRIGEKEKRGGRESRTDRPVHLSFDIDACDPSIAPGTGTRVDGGLTKQQAHRICDFLSAQCNVVSMDLVEINPELEPTSQLPTPLLTSSSPTVQLGLDLIEIVMRNTIERRRKKGNA